MPYMNEAVLAYYDGKLKTWVGDNATQKTVPSSLYPWTLTDKAGAVTCWPVGGTELKPSVDFIFSETGPAEGTKGPDNPSTITGVSTITVTRCETVGVDSTDYVIDLNGTFYGGSIDLATGVMTVTWWGEYVTSITNTELASTYVRTTLTVTYGHMGSGTAPTYFRSNYDDNGTYVYPRYSAGTARISISLPYEMLGLDPSTATEQTAKSAVESFLAQHPCFVVYKLYTPQTVQLSPLSLAALAQTDRFTPRLNTVYTDAQAVQVGYAKSPIREEYELTQAIVAQGGNI